MTAPGRGSVWRAPQCQPRTARPICRFAASLRSGSTAYTALFGRYAGDQGCRCGSVVLQRQARICTVPMCYGGVAQRVSSGRWSMRTLRVCAAAWCAALPCAWPRPGLRAAARPPSAQALHLLAPCSRAQRLTRARRRSSGVGLRTAPEAVPHQARRMKVMPGARGMLSRDDVCVHTGAAASRACSQPAPMQRWSLRFARFAQRFKHNSPTPALRR